jgi:hypothetical protein
LLPDTAKTGAAVAAGLSCERQLFVIKAPQKERPPSTDRPHGLARPEKPGLICVIRLNFTEKWKMLGNFPTIRAKQPIVAFPWGWQRIF